MAQPETSAARRCANCGALLLGPFCHECGQSAQVHRSLSHLLHESLHHLLHFETRGWRTLPLLVARPGLLTRRYIDGQRKRYLSPLPLFLFSVFLLFLVYSELGGSHVAKQGDAAAARAELTRQIEQDQAEIERAQARAGANAARDPEVIAARRELSVTQATRALIDQQLAARKAGGGAADSLAALASTAGGLHIHTGLSLLDRRLSAQLANPDLLLYKLRSAASKLAIALVPISLPFLWLMFLGRPEITMYDHAVFSFYSLSFMSMLFIVAALLGAIGLEGAVATLVVFVPPLHMFWQLRETYQLRSWAALWRTAALLCIAGGAFVLFLVLIVVMAIR
jgi:uncharacterized protein DUF3667